MWMEVRLELYETAYSNCVADLEIGDLGASDLRDRYFEGDYVIRTESVLYVDRESRDDYGRDSYIEDGWTYVREYPLTKELRLELSILEDAEEALEDEDDVELVMSREEYEDRLVRFKGRLLNEVDYEEYFEVEQDIDGTNSFYYGKWLIDGYEVYEVDLDYDLHEFLIVRHGVVVLRIDPITLENQVDLVEHLNADGSLNGLEDTDGYSLRV